MYDECTQSNVEILKELFQGSSKAEDAVKAYEKGEEFCRSK
jgi:exonuclease VII small subunit